MYVKLRAKVINGPEGELTRIYIYCQCGKELESTPVHVLTRSHGPGDEPSLVHAQCVDCKAQQPALRQ